MAKMPRGSDLYQMGLSKGYDKGAELERERIVNILRRQMNMYDCELEGKALEALRTAVHAIEAKATAQAS